MSDPHFKDQIDRAFVEGLSRGDFADLRAHLLECDDCRNYYDRLGEVDRVLSPHRTRDQIADRILGTKAPVLQISTWTKPAAAVAAVAAAVILFFSLKPANEYGVRGGEVRKFEGRPPGLRAVCIDPTTDRIISAAHSGSLTCGIDHVLQLAYSTPKTPHLHLAAWGEMDTGGINWYAPREPDAPLLDLQPDVIDQALPWSTTLAVKHHPGKLRLRVRFFDRSMTAEEARNHREPLAEQALELELTPKR